MLEVLLSITHGKRQVVNQLHNMEYSHNLEGRIVAVPTLHIVSSQITLVLNELISYVVVTRSETHPL